MKCRGQHQHRGLIRSIPIAVWALAVPLSAIAQPLDLSETTKLVPGDASSEDSFALSVALSGDLAVMGAPRANGTTPDSGAAYVYRKIAGVWTSEAKLAAASSNSLDRFGTSVAADGDVVVVGATLSDVGAFNAGAAYVYRFGLTGWVEEAVLTAPDAAQTDGFGTSVSVSGDVAMVGAPLDDDGTSSTGSVYVYRFNGLSWALETKLTVSGAVAGAQLGTAISLQGATALIGAPFQSGSGTVYVYEGVVTGGGVNWSATHTILPSDPESDEQFGFAISFDGDRAIIGAPLDDFDLSGGGSVLNSGSAYIFGTDGSTWTEEAKLTRAGGGAASDYFGYSAAICGGRAIVGAYLVDGGSDIDTGAAYTYRLDGSSWVEESMLTAHDPMSGSFFGYSVAVCETALVGAWGQVPSGSALARFGAAYLYELGPVGDVDTDGDGLTDGDETTIYGTDPLLADTDGDGLTDGEEVNIYLTDPLLADTDGDNLQDGLEVSLQAFGNCPNPLLADSDGDGLTDDIEVYYAPLLDPCDADMDDDGLSDGNENLLGTDPTNPDTDGDGLLDGTEVDMAHAQGGSCPNPLLADSDGDTLSDGAELSGGTDLCNPDTDGDGANDAVDPTPTVPGVSSGVIEDWLRLVSDDLQAFDLSLFDAPNNNAARGRRLVAIIQLQLAAKATSRGRFQFAIRDLELLRARVDDDPRPRDWMNPSPEKTQVLQDIDLAISWLEYELQ